MNPSLSLTRSLFFYFKKCICMFLNKNCVYLRCTIWRFDTHGEIVTTVKLIILSCPHIIIVFPCDAAASAAKSLQSCPTLCGPTDGSPPGSPVPGILQARTLEWVAISFSNAWKWKVKVKSLSRVQLWATPWTAAHQALGPWDFPGKSTGVGCHCLPWQINFKQYKLPAPFQWTLH